jgi:formylglycine-generating enzyme required for sulfatase activity/tRNA A-37 threonylcarbamoyl transferase component Bud32
MKDASSSFPIELLNGRYRYKSELGRGGMGVTYLYEDLKVQGRPVVVKFAKRESDSELQEELEDRVRKELTSLLAVDHAHIVKVIDAGVVGRPFIVLNYLSGGTLARRTTPMAPATVLQWLRPVAGALDFIHDKNMLHRDVKPSNLIFDQADEIYLADFGIAKIIRPDSLVEHTQAGSKPFCSPEQWAGRKVTRASDQYSLAATVYWCLCGAYTHDLNQLSDKSRFDAVHIDARIPDVLPVAASTALMQALAIHADRRFKTCREFVQAFEDGLRGYASAARLQAHAWAPSESEPPTVSFAGAPIEVTSTVSEEFERVDAQLSGPELFRHKKTGIEFVLIPRGRFEMGSTSTEPNRRSDEMRHEVVLSPFLIARHPCTYAQWKRIMGAPKRADQGDAHLPIDRVSWTAVVQFCRASGLQLPTEAQWEYACRAGTKGPFAGSIAEMAWFGRNSSGRLHPVGTKTPNAWGLYDFHGNVSEWCADHYGPFDPDGSSDPIGPSSGRFRVHRGGACVDVESSCRSACRQFCTPATELEFLGFRPAKSLA